MNFSQESSLFHLKLIIMKITGIVINMFRNLIVDKLTMNPITQFLTEDDKIPCCSVLIVKEENKMFTSRLKTFSRNRNASSMIKLIVFT